jgi:drug/metabolite transporter (DMT)-like permease
LNFAAAARLPLAELGALVKSSVLFTVVFGMLLLGESRSWRRILLTLLGFGGVALVLRPSPAMELSGALMALGCAFFASFSALAIRELGGREHPLTVVFHFSAVCAIGLLIGFSHTFVWPQGSQWAWLLGCGLAGTIGQILVTQALYRAPASAVAPFSFSEVLFAAVLGIVLFGDRLSVLTVLGAGIIICCGVMLARLGTR